MTSVRGRCAMHRQVASSCVVVASVGRRLEVSYMIVLLIWSVGSTIYGCIKVLQKLDACHSYTLRVVHLYIQKGKDKKKKIYSVCNCTQITLLKIHCNIPSTNKYCHRVIQSTLVCHLRLRKVLVIVFWSICESNVTI